MAIVKLQPDASLAVNHTTPETIEAPSKSIFTSLVPESRINSLLKYVEGYPWTVNYYGQILNTNNTLEHFDPSTPNLTQPYYKITKLILQVDSPLSSSYDQTTGMTSITGSAISPYKITPNVGDVFIAQVDSGEDAIFHITSVTRKTHRKDTLYDISYTLYSYTSVNPDFVVTLEQRVNDTYYFNSDSNFFNRDVLIKPSVKEAIDRLSYFLHESKEYYFSTFVQRRTGSLLIPGLEYAVYDPLLVNFISKTVDYDYLINTPFYNHAYSNEQIDQPSIYDAILSRSLSILNNANKTYNFLPTSLIRNMSRLGTVFHSRVDYILHPTQPNINTSLTIPTIFDSSEYLTNMKTSRNYSNSSPIVVKTTNNDEIFDKVLLHELFNENYYIVSKNFYTYLNDNTTYSNISYIELLIAKFLKKESIAKEDLVVAIETYLQWSLLHQVLLLPVLWVIITHSIK